MAPVRKSISIEGFGHGDQPIPAASRIGSFLMTGGVYGLDRATGQLPNDVDEQVRLMFDNLERILEVGNASFDQVIRMTFFVKGPEARAAINAQWLKAFPNPASRPARHTLHYDNLLGAMLVQCDAVAVCAEG